MLGFSNMDTTYGRFNETAPTGPTIAFQDPYSDTLVMGAIDVKTGKTIDEPGTAVQLNGHTPSRRWMWWLAAGVATYFVLR